MPRPNRPSESHTRRLLSTARRAALEVGEFVASKHRTAGQAADRKGEGDFVTAIDLAAEQRLRKLLMAAHPDHAILGEEHPPHQLGADFCWILDPIDGTSNFAHGLPLYSVSVACVYQGSPLVGALACQPEDVVYSAAKGFGAFRGRRRLRLGRGRLDDASICGVQWHRGVNAIPYLDALVATGTRVRNFGCTVTQLCDVAAGRLEGNVQEQGKIWDFAAAALVVQEAGGRFTDWRGEAIFPVTLDAAGFDPDRHYPSIAAPPAVHRQLCALLGDYQAAVQR